MNKYLSSNGLQYLWGKIKTVFVTKEELSSKILDMPVGNETDAAPSVHHFGDRLSEVDFRNHIDNSTIGVDSDDELYVKSLSADKLTDGTNNKVFTATEQTKLAGITAGAEVNVQSDWNVTDSSLDSYILNKPTNVSSFTNDAGYITSNDLPSTMGASGSSHAGGLVPDPGSTQGTTKYLREDGTWQTPPDNNTTYSANDFDIKDLADSTSLRSTWSGKLDALTPQTAYTSLGSATKVPQITTNSLGQVTSIVEVSIQDSSGKADKVSSATNGNFAGLDSNGNLTDSGHKPSDYLEEDDVFDTPDANGHDYVDLGLPSRTLWATMNVGANNATDYGNYYAWGRTTPYSENDTKYDGNEQLYDSAHDAASLVWGGDWHTPTENLILELIQHTKVTVESGCYKYESFNDPTKYILIPIAGLYSTNLPASTTPLSAGTYAYLWSNTNNLGDASGTTAKFYSPTSLTTSSWPKVHGASVRPVLDGKKPKYVANIYLIQANWSQTDMYAPDFILQKPTVTDSKLVTTTSVSDNTTYYPIVGANSSSASTKNIDSTGYKYNSVSGTTLAAGYSTVTLGNGTASGTTGSKRGQLALYDNGTHSNTLNSTLLTANRILSLPDEDGTLATQAYVSANGGAIDTIQVDGTALTITNKTVNITGKADKVLNATNGHLAGLDANGNLTDSGVVPSNMIVLSDDNGVGIVPEDGIRAETITSAATMSINSDVVTVIDGAVGTATITLQVPNDNLAHVWDIFLTTDSTISIIFVMSKTGATIKMPTDLVSISTSKSIEINVVGSNLTYYLRYGEFT